ncbi:MAG: co-chaperone DjlA [Pseudomonadota bacterium]
MSWLGKVFGGTFGFLMGGPLGAVLGAALGHQFDVGMEGLEHGEGVDFSPGDRQRTQMAFFTATFSTMGHVAKADGRVSEAEIAVARHVMAEMALNEEMRRAAMRLFNEGKSPAFPLDAALDQFRRECRRRTTLMRMFIEIQFQAAVADGMLHPGEERILLHICGKLGISRLEYERLKAILMAQQRFTGGNYSRQRGAESAKRQPRLEDAYAALGVSPTATVGDIKRAYRRLMSQHHPDKLVAKGLPEEMMKLATEKTQMIRKAYEAIRKARGF